MPDTSPLASVLEVLRDAHSQSAVVVGEYGTVNGLITLEDVMEELVGEIRDEHDPPEDPDVVHAAGDGRWEVAGRARLDEVERATGIVLPPGDYDTVAGLVVAELGRLAEVGDTVTVDPIGTVDDPAHPIWVRVDAVDGYQVISLTVLPDDPDAPADAEGPAGHVDDLEEPQL